VAGSLSVVIPCYNYGRYLRACVESVLAQNVDVDISIIDDASTDDTERVGSLLADEDPRVTFQRHVKNCGHIATYNEGLERAQGTYSLLLSADDMLAPGAMRRACEVLDAHPDVVLLYGDVLEFSDVPPPVVEPTAAPEVNIWTGQDFIAKCCKEVWNPVPTPAAVVRTSAQKAVGGYRPALPHAGDREIWLRLATQGNVAELRGTVQAFYRLHDLNMHRQWFYDFLVNEREFRTAYETFFKHSGPFVQDSDKLQRLCSQRLAERGIWWAYQKLRRMQVRGALECLQFAASVWRDKPEDGVSLLNVRDVLPPLSYAIRERQRRKHGTRFAPVTPASAV
jgi:glycosyltransferase involved in cell wall biosynthesis